MGTARRSSEACLKPWSRTKSSRCRAVYHPHAVSNRHPQRCPPLPGIDTTIGGSDFRTPPPVSSPFKLVHGCPHPADRDTDLLGYRAFSMSGSLWPRTPGSTGTARRGAVPVVACRRDKSVGTDPPNFSGLNTFKVGSTRSLYTSPAHQAYASTRPSPFAPQGSILGSRLTTTQVGFPPLRDIAKPHCPPISAKEMCLVWRRSSPVAPAPGWIRAGSARYRSGRCVPAPHEHPSTPGRTPHSRLAGEAARRPPAGAGCGCAPGCPGAGRGAGR